ncbi:MAG: redoxin family protein [Candidatus Hinthialibacter antarcticus]|nr:redoxin family protein [Candidatus Hinthialibacter antarcticus]
MRTIVLTFAIIAALILSAAPYAADYKPMEIGSAAVPFSWPGTDGKTYTLDDFADAKLLVIVFTANHCPTAQAYEDRIIALHKEYNDKGVALVAVAPNDALALRLDEMGYTDVGDTLADMKIRAKDKKFAFPYLYAGDQPELCQKYGPIATPHIFVFDEERKLRYQGRIDNAEKPSEVTTRDAKQAIDALLAGVNPPIETTKTFGCSIKWPDKRHLVKQASDQWAKEEVTLAPIDVSGLQELMKNDSDKLRVINVWATWCGPCVTEFPELVTIHRMYRNRDFEMITISSDAIKKKDKVLGFLQKNEASMRNYIFSGKSSYELVEALDKEWLGALPYTVIVKPGGEVIFRTMEGIDPLEVKRKIVSVLGRVYE